MGTGTETNMRAVARILFQPCKAKGAASAPGCYWWGSEWWEGATWRVPPGARAYSLIMGVWGRVPSGGPGSRAPDG